MCLNHLQRTSSLDSGVNYVLKTSVMPNFLQIQFLFPPQYSYGIIVDFFTKDVLGCFKDKGVIDWSPLSSL
jgi:hypothetical protein